MNGLLVFAHGQVRSPASAPSSASALPGVAFDDLVLEGVD
jgi:hypothetical protein